MQCRTGKRYGKVPLSMALCPAVTGGLHAGGYQDEAAGGSILRGIFMEFTVDYRVEAYILNTKWDSFPDDIRERAVVCGIDLMMALIIGSRGGQFAAGTRLAKKIGALGETAAVGTTEKYNLLGATIAMSHASNSFDIDDGHNMIKGHPGTSFVAGILAAGLEKDISYREYLTVLVTAYETSIRWAKAMQNHYGYLHSTGAYGAYGTAAGAGRILGLDRAQLNNALSIADFHAPMTPVMRSVEYPSMNKDGVPFGSLVGMTAVLETLAGSSGVGNILEMPEYRGLTETLGSDYEIMNLYFKPYTCCRWAHQPIAACVDLMEEHGFDGEDVELVEVHTFDSAARLSKKIPESADEAQYNIAWPVASALIFGDVGFKQVHESGLGNPKVLDMMKRLKFSVDEEIDRQFPAKRLAWVSIKLKDGREYRSRVYEAPGEHTDHVDLKWITDKFMRITGPMLKPEDQTELIRRLSADLDAPLRSQVAGINQMLGVQ